MDREECKNCLCASCAVNIALNEIRGSNACIGCEKCKDFAVNRKGQCPIGKYEKKQTLEEGYDPEKVTLYRKIVGITNRITYGAIGLLLILCVLIRNNNPVLIAEGVLLLVAVGAYFVHKKYTTLLMTEAFTKLPETTEQEQEDV